MRSILHAGLVMVVVTLLPIAAQAGPVEGAGIGAGSGAVIAGPPGAVVGGVVGALVGGPDIVTKRKKRTCWTDRRGNRQCGWR